MPRQNRVTPFGELAAAAVRGTLMGNRGILHDEAGRVGTRRWAHTHWVACRLAFKGRRRPLMVPGRYTELFFLDEATALAAGHRPCAECRREDFLRFQAAWARAHPGEPATAPAIDRALHAARVRRDRSQVWFERAASALPTGAMVALDGSAWLVSDGCLRPWRMDGYGEARALPPGLVSVLTPHPAVAALSAGYAAALHPTATDEPA
ncbi:hypothetical protein [Aureimonas sp. AU4]|uniref:hypothetical protein n=1 Tax=Aureimonas sp. AU4 TaxID=1638163 RepID=UPI0007809C1E|nr:hypothetical protein [Aureimonas sp. AU4]